MGDMWLALDPLLSDGNGGLIVWAVSEAHGAQSGSRSTDGGQSQPQPVAHKLLFQCLAKKIDTVVQSLPGFASREVSETLAAVQREAVVFPPFFCWGCALLLLPMYMLRHYRDARRPRPAQHRLHSVHGRHCVCCCCYMQVIASFMIIAKCTSSLQEGQQNPLHLHRRRMQAASC